MLCDRFALICGFELIVNSCGFQFNSVKNQNGKVMAGDLPPLMVKLKAFRDMYSEEDIRGTLSGLGSNFSDEIDFESFLKVSHIVC